MLINTYLDTEDFVHLYYPEDEPPQTAQGCGAGARMHTKYPPRPPSPDYGKITSSSSEMGERERARAPPPPEPPPHRVRAADLYPKLRTHYDEPGLDVPFTPICGEFVQWVGRTADGGSLAMSSYRVHVQRRRRAPGLSVPLRLVDAVEVRDLVHLALLCKDGKTIKCTFSTGEQCLEWWRRLSAALSPAGSVQETFAAAYAAWAREQPPSSVHRTLMRASHAPQRHWFGPELERLEFTAKGAWRVSTANAEYKLCPSYPPLLIVPATIGDEDLDSVARFRAMRRVPAVVWRHRASGAVLARSSQPEVGWLGWRSAEDERLLAAFVAACNLSAPPGHAKQNKLLIVDARSYASAVTNRARGGGCECQQYYPLADIQFMCLPNIHHVRRSFQQLRQLLAEPADQPNWHSNLERTLWLQYVSGLGRAAVLSARAVLAGRPVLVHCSDGWDRTPQIVAAAQLLLDPYYRSCEGFRVLIEREWLDFGHKFALRCGHQLGPEEPNERSPIFLQWLDLVHQLMLQYPCSFEFSQAYLIKLVTHVHSCMFGTFMCNSAKERAEARVNETTAQIWKLLEGPAYRNHLYSPPVGDHVLYPDVSVRALRCWRELFCGEGPPADEPAPPPPPAPLDAPPPHGGGMSKTRSCDDLLAEGERRSTARRSSDPSVAPDLMKLSTLLASRERSPLTDSYVDTLRASEPIDLARNNDQVDGLRADHFENGSSPGPARDIASNSSSLERELAPAHTEIPHETSRLRNISWRSSFSELSQTDSSIEQAYNMNSATSPENHNSRAGDLANHNVDMAATLTDAERARLNGTAASHLADKLLQVDLLDHQGVSAAWSSGSSESEGERERGVARTSRRAPCACRRPRAVCRYLDGVCSESVRWGALCVCGAGGGGAARDPLDGLPPAADPLQARLHHVILQQRIVVETLTGQLKLAQKALRQQNSPSPASSAPPPPPPPPDKQMTSSLSGSVSGSSGSASEVEVGEEARGVVWLPDSSAPRCQHCRGSFWLARRRHHCRKCGGIFCGSCSEMSAIGEWTSVRLCHRCRALR